MTTDDQASRDCTPELERLRSRIAELEANEESRRGEADKLRRALARYRDVYENILDGLFESNLQGQVIDANPAMARLFGYASPQEFMESVTDAEKQIYVNPQDHRKIVSELNKTKFVNEFEFEARRRDGSRFWVSVTARVVSRPPDEARYYAGSVRDISYRKGIELDREREHRWLLYHQIILENMSEIVVSIDAEGRLFFNRRAREVHGEPPAPGLPPEDWPRMYGLYQIDGKTLLQIEDLPLYRAWKLGEVVKSFEMSARLPGGEIRSFLGSAVPIRDKEGNISAAVAIMSDITEQRRVRSAFLDILIEALPVMVFYKDRDGRYLDCNSQFARMLGKTREEIRGKTIDQLYPKPLADLYHRRDEEILRTLKPQEYDHLYRRDPEEARRRGHQSYEDSLETTAQGKLDVRILKNLYPGIDGRGGGIVGVVIDNTREKLAERQERLAQLGSIAAQMAHNLKNPAQAVGNNARFLRDSAAKMNAIDLELFSQPINKAQSDKIRALGERIRDFALQASELSDRERSRSKRELESWLRPQVDNPGALAVNLVDYRFDRAALEEAVKAFDDRRPSAILFWISATCAIYKALSRLESVAAHIARVSEDVTNYVRESQEPSGPVDVAESLGLALDVVLSKFGGTIEVRREFAKPLPLVLAHKQELAQVWDNLLDNASTSMQGRGTIVVKAFLPAGEGDIRIEFTDDGPGIPPSVQSKIFDPFFTTKGRRGTGLGLSTSRRMIERINGTLELIKSKPGQTTFRVQLPAAP